jgi:Rrf2 family protein
MDFWRMAMKVSTKGRYGLRIMVELAAHHGSGPLQVTAIAQSQRLPAKYIHVLVGGLKAAGLITAVRGPNGGLELARDPARITPLDVVEALEGRVSAVDCTLDPALCDHASECVTREVWAGMAAAMEASLKRQTLADLAEKVRNRATGSNAYVI